MNLPIHNNLIFRDLKFVSPLGGAFGEFPGLARFLLDQLLKVGGKGI